MVHEVVLLHLEGHLSDLGILVKYGKYLGVIQTLLLSRVMEGIRVVDDPRLVCLALSDLFKIDGRYFRAEHRSIMVISTMRSVDLLVQVYNLVLLIVVLL